MGHSPRWQLDRITRFAQLTHVPKSKTCHPLRDVATNGSSDVDPQLTHSSLEPHKLTSKTASPSVPPLLQTSLTNRQTDTHTDIPRYSICSNKLHLAIAAMQPNNNGSWLLTLSNGDVLGSHPPVNDHSRVVIHVQKGHLTVLLAQNKEHLTATRQPTAKINHSKLCLVQTLGL